METRKNLEKAKIVFGVPIIYTDNCMYIYLCVCVCKCMCFSVYLCPYVYALSPNAPIGQRRYRFCACVSRRYFSLICPFITVKNGLRRHASLPFPEANLQGFYIMLRLHGGCLHFYGSRARWRYHMPNFPACVHLYKSVAFRLILV